MRIDMRKILADINRTIVALESIGFYKESDSLDKIFVKIAQLVPGLGEAIQQVGPFADFQKFTLPKQQQLGNFPVGSNAWNKSIQIALGIPAQQADGIFGPKSQQALNAFKSKYPSDYDRRLASMLKPAPQMKAPSMPSPTGYTGP